MTERQFDPIRYNAATAVFRLGVKTYNSGMHRTLNRDPKGKGWVACNIGPKGLFCKPDKIREAIQYFEIAYSIHPDIVALHQIALGLEIIGDLGRAKTSFNKMLDQALQEKNEAYEQAAKMGLQRCS
jgi:tetratricopeptide (TPR) repeat protein